MPLREASSHGDESRAVANGGGCKLQMPCPIPLLNVLEKRGVMSYLRHLWRWFRYPETRSACEAVKKAFASEHPTDKAAGLLVRALEQGQIVVCIVIEPAYLFRGGAVHIVYMPLEPTPQHAEELIGESTCPYVLRSTK